MGQEFHDEAGREGPPGPMMRLVGIGRTVDWAVGALAGPDASSNERIWQVIRNTSEQVEREIERAGLTPERLTAASRQARGWLAFFADRRNLDAYRSGVAAAAAAFAAALAGSKRFPLPVRVHFRPIAGLFRLRGFADATRVVLPTPMISFDRPLFEALAGSVRRSRSSPVPRTPSSSLSLQQTASGSHPGQSAPRAGRQLVLEATAADAYQDIQAELESLGGLAERTAGECFDLAAVFARVNAAQFGGSLARPRLTWSRSLTRRKFGHYDHVRDTVMISATLDRPAVPAFVVDYVMFHELLHKRLGIDWRNGRARSHTPEFRAAERRFPRLAEADAALKKLAERR